MEQREKEIFYWVYDIRQVMIGIIRKSEEKNLTKGLWLRGVSCFVINENDEILIEKRVDKGLTPNELDLCSGHIDGNEFPKQAMIRELSEELGIDSEKASEISTVRDYEYPISFENNGDRRNFFINFYCLKVKKEDINFNKEEVKAIAWLPMEKTFELIKRGKTKFPENFNYENIFDSVRKYCKEINNNKEQDDNEKE